MLLALASLLLLQASDAPPGQRIDLDGATLFVPEGYRPKGDRIHLVLHLHGAGRAVESALIAAGWPAVLIEFNRPGLSSVYTGPFSDPKLFPDLIARALRAVEAKGLAKEAKAGTVIVSAFSAGFGGVRELLKVPEHAARIDGLVLADSLYAGYAGDRKDQGIDPEKIAMFARFAAEAAGGRKAFVLTHSAQVPDGYASTTETADEVIRRLGGEAVGVSVDWGDGWTETRRYAAGRLLILGFAGAEAADHMRHLREIGKIWKELPVRFD